MFRCKVWGKRTSGDWETYIQADDARLERNDILSIEPESAGEFYMGETIYTVTLKSGLQLSVTGLSYLADNDKI